MTFSYKSQGVKVSGQTANFQKITWNKDHSKYIQRIYAKLGGPHQNCKNHLEKIFHILLNQRRIERINMGRLARMLQTI